MAHSHRWLIALLSIASMLTIVVAGIVPTVTAQTPSIIPIGAVQGAVSDTDDGTTHRSPFAPPSGNSVGETVAVHGVIYQKTLARTSSGGSQHGIFIQNTAATADGNLQTSDGIFVFMGGFSTLRHDGGGVYEPQVGDEVVLRGPVVEFFNLTQLSNPFLVEWYAAASTSTSRLRRLKRIRPPILPTPTATGSGAKVCAARC